MELKLKINYYVNNVLKVKYSTVIIEKVSDQQYKIYGLTEQNLIDEGFEFTEYDLTGYIPTYKYNNLFAGFIGDVVYLLESTSI